MRLVVAQSQFSCQLNEDTHLKIILHSAILLQDILLPWHIQSIGYHGWGRTVLLNSFTYSKPGTVGDQLGILQHWFLGQKCNLT